MPAKILRASVIKSGEWFKDRDPDEWKITRLQVLRRDQYACAYCRWTCRKFMQVNHIGAEDDHSSNNLETVCAACHSVLHLGISSMGGLISVFDCQPEVTNMAVIVRATRAMIARSIPWPEIEQRILGRLAKSNGHIYSRDETVAIANYMLASIPPGAFRGYLPEGKAILFHERQPWNGFAESIWRWQCLPGSHYRKD